MGWSSDTGNAIFFWSYIRMVENARNCLMPRPAMQERNFFRGYTLKENAFIFPEFIAWWLELPMRKMTRSNSRVSRNSGFAMGSTLICLLFTHDGGGDLPTERMEGSRLRIWGPIKPLPPKRMVRFMVCLVQGRNLFLQ